MKRTSLGLCCAAMFACAPALAQHAAHEHGVAQLKVALDGEVLLIELESPLDNLVGFESAPRTDAQHDALAQAQRILADAGALFGLDTQAACTLRDVQLESPFDDHDHDHDHEHDHEHDHDHEHEDDHGGDQTAAGEAHSDDAHAHSDMYVAYEFACAAPAALKGVEVKLFDAFPRIASIRAALAGPSGQKAATLGQGARRLDF